MNRPYNFNPGPATIPDEVLKQAAAELLDWRGCGMGVMEMSHRGKEFISIYEQTQADIRRLLRVPEDYHVLFMQGGALAENAIVPLNISQGGVVDFVITGVWSQKSYNEAGKYAQAHIAASTQQHGYTSVPDPGTWQLSKNARYVHICSNETVHGVEFLDLPDLKALGSNASLVIDFSSHVASRAMDWSRIALAFGGAQKNLGPAGVTLVIVHKDLVGHALPICPSAFDFRLVAESQSMFNTPPTFAIYMVGLVFQWIGRQREGDLQGVAALEARNIAKAKLLYDFIDQSQLYYSRVSPAARSRMNVPFFLRDESRNEAFVEGASAQGLLGLKGHKMVGGMRASIYNAMPLSGVQKLVQYMREFERHQA